ncbi:hypothetical protein MHU86_10812 [Fragilaria crotonensis]|nr:hypothetical protein MHU86_10812 [Fragilaria crotonensis]
MMSCIFAFVLCSLCSTPVAFQPLPPSRQSSALHDKDSQVEEYRNAATNILSNFMTDAGKMSYVDDPLGSVDFDAPKVRMMPIEQLAEKLDRELYEKEWFVTGNVNPTYFSPNFQFQDPDVKLSGIEEYARAVNKLFDQNTSRAEIISTTVTSPTTITVTWRLSGKVKIGPGLNIKPYICYTDFLVDNQGLICFQEDRFDIPGWDILPSALFPFLIGKVTAAPAPPVEPRTFDTQNEIANPFEALLQRFFK